MTGKIPPQSADIKALIAQTQTHLVGVAAYGVELAVVLSTLLQRHGYLEVEPSDLSQLIAAARAVINEGAPEYVVVQAGGSSTETYASTFDTERDAAKFRRSSADAAYNTSDPVTVPKSLAIHPRFGVVVQDILKASRTMNYQYPT